MSGATWTVTYTASGYEYTITSISADHSIVFAYSGGAVPELYIKRNGSWVQVQTAYVKQNGSWVEVALDQVFSAGVNYVQG